jgi:hypothetical protein
VLLILYRIRPLAPRGIKPKEIKNERRGLMRVVFVIFVALAVLFAPISSIARKGASDKAYERASDKAKFKREKDWFDKTEKKNNEEVSEKDKEMSKEEKEIRKEERKLEKEEKKAAKKAEKEKKKFKKKNKK